MTTPTPTVHGTPPATNPDTGNPLPSPTPAQLALVDELCARLDEQLALNGDTVRATIRQALVEVAVRQQGRTLRACRADLDAQIAANDREAAELLADAVSDTGAVSTSRVTAANTLALASHALRLAPLRGER